jgi:hypothetical protein
MLYQHLLNADFVVTQLLKNQNFAKEKVEGWVKTCLNIHSINELANAEHVFNSQFSYVINPKTHFTKLDLDGQYYINPGTLAFWTGHASGNVTAKIRYSKKLYGQLGVIQLDDGDTPRTTFAKDRYMFAYAKLSSKLTLIPPSAAAAFILTSSNERCESFRNYIQDQVPELPYHTGRLVKTINELKINA